MHVAQWVTVALGVLAALVTVLSLFPGSHWIVRLWDFPRHADRVPSPPRRGSSYAALFFDRRRAGVGVPGRHGGDHAVAGVQDLSLHAVRAHAGAAQHRGLGKGAVAGNAAASLVPSADHQRADGEHAARPAAAGDRGRRARRGAGGGDGRGVGEGAGAAGAHVSARAQAAAGELVRDDAVLAAAAGGRALRVPGAGRHPLHARGAAAARRRARVSARHPPPPAGAHPRPGQHPARRGAGDHGQGHRRRGGPAHGGLRAT